MREANRLCARHAIIIGGDELARGVATLPAPALVRCNRLLLQSSIECVLPYRLDLATRPARCWGDGSPVGSPVGASIKTRPLASGRMKTWVGS